MTGSRSPGPGDEHVFALFMTPEGRADPFPLYHALREADPVHWTALGFWMLTGWEGCARALRSPALARDFVGMRSLTGNDPSLLSRPCYASQAQWIVYRNPPDSTRLRGLVKQAFSHAFVQELRPQMESIVADLIDARTGERQMEVIEDLAYPLPLLVITRMLGAETANRDLFRQWAMDIAATLEPIVAPEVSARADESMLAAEAYFARPDRREAA